jgi:hypothetical protein
MCVHGHASTHACAHEYWCGRTNASVPCHGSKKWDKVQFSTQLCTSILPTFTQLAASWTLQLHACLTSALTVTVKRPALLFHHNWVFLASYFSSQICYPDFHNSPLSTWANTSIHPMTTSLPILYNSLFIYSLSLYDSLRYQLCC